MRRHDDALLPERWELGGAARGLALTTLLLQAFGLVVLYSASALLARHEGHSSAYYLWRQLGGVALGLAGLFAFARVDAERWRSAAWAMLLGSAALLLLTVLPGTEAVAPRINGSRRWLRLGIVIQPSELGKVAVVVWTAMLVVRKGRRIERLTKGLLPFLVGVGLLAALAFLEPDLSIGLTYFLIMGIVLFAAGAPIGHFLWLGALGIPVAWHQLDRLQYAVLRVIGFFDRGTVEARAAVNYQLKQSLVAIGSGGTTGVGYGQGVQQSGFLPFPFSDFIGSNVGEEWGVLGMLLVLGGFAVYGWMGFRIAAAARTEFQRLVAVGLTVTTVLTAYLHLGVVVGLLPTTGLTLPFFSYGRTNLVLSLWMTGVLLNIGSRRRTYLETPVAEDPLPRLSRSAVP